MSHADHLPPGVKKLARLRDDPGAGVLCVDNDKDWIRMKELSEGRLICHADGCDAAFTKPYRNENGTRWLQHMPGTTGCRHTFVRLGGGGGGPMSAKHRWLQRRLASMCAQLEHEPSIEYVAREAKVVTVSDLYLLDIDFDIEVQLVQTEFMRRTAARFQTGAAGVLWLLGEDLSGPALFEAPSAKLRVHAKGRRDQLLVPWEDPRQERDARLSVCATVAKLHKSTMTVSYGWHDGWAFLSEVLSGERRWHPPGTLGRPWPDFGVWVKETDLAETRRRLRATRPRDISSPGATADSSPGGSTRAAVSGPPAAMATSIAEPKGPSSGPTTSGIDQPAIASLGAKLPRRQSVRGRRLRQRIRELFAR